MKPDVFVLRYFALFVLVFAVLSSSTTVESRQLRFLIWSDYLDADLVSEFEQQFSARIEQIHYETDIARDEMLIQADGKGFDLVLVNGVTLSVYRRQNWLAALDPAQLPNLKHIEPRWLNAFDAAAGYAVPYFWGTMGIAYRTDLVPQPITTWRQLLQPVAALHGKIVMLNDNRDLISAALTTLGYSINTTDTQELNEAKALLMAQKPYVKDYSYVALNEESALVSGEVVAAMIFNGDALMLQEHHDNITYVLPEEGSELWVDYLVIMQASTEKELALAFINFLNEPEHAARLAQFVYYPTPNKAAEKLLPEEFLSDPVIYPGQKALAKSEFLVELPPRVMKQYSSILATIVR